MKKEILNTVTLFGSKYKKTPPIIEQGDPVREGISPRLNPEVAQRFDGIPEGSVDQDQARQEMISHLVWQVPIYQRNKNRCRNCSQEEEQLRQSVVTPRGLSMIKAIEILKCIVKMLENWFNRLSSRTGSSSCPRTTILFGRNSNRDRQSYGDMDLDRGESMQESTLSEHPLFRCSLPLSRGVLKRSLLTEIITDRKIFGEFPVADTDSVFFAQDM